MQGQVTSSLSFLAPARSVEPSALSEQEFKQAMELPDDDEDAKNES